MSFTVFCKYPNLFTSGNRICFTVTIWLFLSRVLLLPGKLWLSLTGKGTKSLSMVC